MIDCSYNNLIDLKDHCLLCYRTTRVRVSTHKRDAAQHHRNNESANNGTTSASEKERNGNVEEDDINIDVEKVSEDEEDAFSPKSCKLFLKLLSRYLQLPSAVLTIVLGGDDSEPKTIRKRWENLITGTVCNTCQSVVQSFCDLFRQYEHIKTQMDLRLQDIEQCIHFTERESTCLAGRNLLKRKWESDEVDSKHSFELLHMLRADIISQVTKKNNLPVVRLQRIRSSEPVHFHHEDSDEESAPSISENLEMINKVHHRPSITDDSGVSSNSASSPHSSVSYEDVERQFISADQQSTNLDVSSRNNGKEYKIMRKVIRCKKCNKKIVGKARFREHLQSDHPSSTVQTNILSTGTNSELSPKKYFTLKKTGIICPGKDCSAKFLGRETFLTHLNEYHPELVSKYSGALLHTSIASSTIIAPSVREKVSETNNNNIQGNQSIEKDSDREEVVETNIQVDDQFITGDLDTNRIPATAETAANVLEDQSIVEDSNAKIVGHAGTRPKTKKAIYRKRNYPCLEKFCTRKFHTPEELDTHSQGHRKHQCTFCHKLCKNPSSIALHEVGKHGDFKGHTWKDRPVPFQCPRCTDKFRNINTYKAHFWKSHLKSHSASFKCFECKSVFINPRTFQRHVKKCERLSKIISDPDCSNQDNANEDNTKEKAAEVPTLITPTTTTPPPPPPSRKTSAPPRATGTGNHDTSCNICNLQCNSSYALRHHIIASHDADMLSCPDCPRFFKGRISLENHCQQLHTSSILKLVILRKFCKYCKCRKTFKSLKAFGTHLRQHEISLAKKKALRECPVCKQAFINLGAHLKVHAQESKVNQAVVAKNLKQNKSISAINGNGYPINDQPEETSLANELENSPCSSAELRIKNLADRVKLRRRSCQTPLVDLHEESTDGEEKKGKGSEKRKMRKVIRKRSSRNPIARRYKRKDTDSTKPSTSREVKARVKAMNTRKRSKSIPVTERKSAGNEQGENTQREGDDGNRKTVVRDEYRLPLKKRHPPPSPAHRSRSSSTFKLKQGASPSRKNATSTPILMNNGTQTGQVSPTKVALTSNIAKGTNKSAIKDKPEQQRASISNPKNEPGDSASPSFISERLEQWLAAAEKDKAFDQSDNQQLPVEPIASSSKKIDDDDCIILDDDEDDADDKEKPVEQKLNIDDNFRSNLSDRVKRFLSDECTPSPSISVPANTTDESPTSPEIITLD